MANRIKETLYAQTASDGNTIYVVAVIDCDSASDLPGINDFSGLTLMIGSRAHDIDQNAWYEMQSSGTWVLQQAGTAVYTKAEIDTMIAAINATDAGQQAEIDYSINTGSKNKLLITNANSTLVVNGITFTKNSDQTITATGTATANADYSISTSQALVIGQKYTLSGCPTGGGADSYLLRQLSGAVDYGDGVTFTAASSSANFYIRIRNGYAIQGSLTFKPMLRLADIKDGSYEPYAPTNRDLYLMIQAL